MKLADAKSSALPPRLRGIQPIAAFVALAFFGSAGELRAEPNDSEKVVTIAFSSGKGVAKESLLLSGSALFERPDGRDVPLQATVAGDRIRLKDGAVGTVIQIRAHEGNPVSPARSDRQRVTGTVEHQVTSLIVLRTEHDVVETTPAHAFFVLGEGFKTASAIRAGDLLDSALGPAGERVLSSATRVVPATTVYNLEVENNHTFRVGAAGVLVHNGACFSAPKSKDTPREKIGKLDEAKTPKDQGGFPKGTSDAEIRRLTTPKEYDAIVEFTRGGGKYSDIRLAEGRKDSYLREVKGWSQEKIDATRALSNDLQSGLAKLPPSPGVVYRGINNVSDFQVAKIIDAQASGKPLNLGSFDNQGATSSASTSADTAAGFAERNPSKKSYGVVYKINHKSGKNVENASEQSGEREVILPKDASFRVKTVTKDTTRDPPVVTVELTEI